MTYNMLRDRILRYADKASEQTPEIGFHRVTPHVLRHTCAVHMFVATRDIQKVSLLLGHESMETTEKYLSADPDAKLEILAAQTNLGIKPGKFDVREDEIDALFKYSY